MHLARMNNQHICIETGISELIGHVATQSSEQLPAPTAPAPSFEVNTSIIDETSSTVASSNDTASNLTGAGRVVGNFYSWAGRRVERAFRRVKQKHPSNSEEEVNPHNSTIDDAERDTLDGFSTNATTSNLIGPGRLLGTAYGIAGRRIERFFCKGRLFYGAGYGPLALERRIQNVFLKNGRNYVCDGSRDEYIVRVLCRMLLNYTHWPPILQTTALWVVMDLAIWSPAFRSILQQGGAVVTLSTMAHHTYTTADPAIMNTAEMARSVLCVLEDDELHVHGMQLCPFLQNAELNAVWTATSDGWLKLSMSDERCDTYSTHNARHTLEAPFTVLLGYLLKRTHTWAALLYLNWWCLAIEASPALARVYVPLQLRLSQALALLMCAGDIPRAYPAYSLEILVRRLHVSLTVTLREEIVDFLRNEMQEETADVNGVSLSISDVVNVLNLLVDGLQVSGLTFFEDTVPLERLSLISEGSTLSLDEVIHMEHSLIPRVPILIPLAYPHRRNWKMRVMYREMSDW